MKLIPILILSIAGVCVGQQSEPVPIMQNKVEVKPAPLKCGKYEHNVGEGLSNCHGDPDHPNSNIAICTPVVDCAPDLHTMTEKEYQGWQLVQATQQEVNKALKQYILENDEQLKAIMQRLAKLEKKAQAGSKEGRKP